MSCSRDRLLPSSPRAISSARCCSKKARRQQQGNGECGDLPLSAACLAARLCRKDHASHAELGTLQLRTSSGGAHTLHALSAQPSTCLLLQPPPLRLQLRHFGLQVAGAAGQLAAAAGTDHKCSTGMMLGC